MGEHEGEEFVEFVFVPGFEDDLLDAEVLGAGLLGLVGGLEGGVEWFFILFDFFGEGGLFDGLS